MSKRMPAHLPSRATRAASRALFTTAEKSSNQSRSPGVVLNRRKFCVNRPNGVAFRSSRAGFSSDSAERPPAPGLPGEVPGVLAVRAVVEQLRGRRSRRTASASISAMCSRMKPVSGSSQPNSIRRLGPDAGFGGGSAAGAVAVDSEETDAEARHL